MPDQPRVQTEVETAIAEDLGDGDRTAELIPEDKLLETRVICREDAVLCGQPWFDETFHQLDAGIQVRWRANDGDRLRSDQTVCTVKGNARALLSGERTALNFLQTLSGTASRTAKYVRAVADTGVTILDTRKTLPGMRLAQKYAVRCGGGANHRIGLFDAILIKENHIAAAGSISNAVRKARELHPGLLLEVEVENTDQLEEAAEAGAQRALLDNFSLAKLREAVMAWSGQLELEASGGITLETIAAVAQTGVDYISTGDITKSVRATDFSMRYV
ncbi:MAG TPA: carboxylating nicotinate-nucleotide diphosphorylase [Xanthomonadales bacterium]|nr:carboxylating nicotinate-nucleotide diphosphorylase [Xanthomonadales bacterium]